MHFFLGTHKTSTMTRSGRARSTVATANPAIIQPQSDGELDIEEGYGDRRGEYKKERRTKKKADATNRFASELFEDDNDDNMVVDVCLQKKRPTID